MKYVDFYNFIKQSIDYFYSQSIPLMSFDYYGKVGFSVEYYKNTRLTFTLNFVSIRLVKFTGQTSDFLDFVLRLENEGYFNFL